MAGCHLNVAFPARNAQPRNLLDLDLGDESQTEIVWDVRVQPKDDIGARADGGRWVTLPHGRSFQGDGFGVDFGDRNVLAHHDPTRVGAGLQAAQFAVFGALRRAGRADLHASAIVPPESTEAVVLVGESGHGKSTLTLCAIGAGWSFLSDDLIAVFADNVGALTLAPLRRTLRVAESAVSLLPPSMRGGEWNDEMPRKLIVDPETSGLGARRSRSRPGRLVFLERAKRKESRRLSRAEAFERLMLHSPHLSFDPDGKPAIEALKRLADEVPATVASLPLDSLRDVATLEGFLA